MKLLMESWRRYLSEDEGRQCTNATVLAIADYFGDEVDPNACIGHVTGIDMHMYLQRDMGYKLTNEYGWFQKSAMEGWKPTLKKFMEDYPKGVYYLSSRGHAMALIDGRLVDTAEFRRMGRVLLIGAVRVEKGVEEGRDFQKDSSYIKDHEGNKEELIGDGGQDNSEPYEKNPIKKRSKSAPPAG